ncbi:hypothetical protein ONE63_011613 [Megalurothrips usitatus]|uniref:Cellulase n=1 Tax=Megalurothrips usitatus TaxID=439358 RepID=A0AAV7X2D0_9NEOP|nr:hypothetical protein ONE63_011613 [Megalurothrips usitatus]
MTLFIQSYQGGTGTAKTTRYWDCCKPSCAWRANVGSVTAPVRTCAAGGRKTVGENEQSGCNGGNGFVCNNQRPFVKKGQAYGFATINMEGLPMNQMCCACYKLTFTNTAIKGKNMIVQVSNTGSDLGNNHFDLQLPAGGLGIFDQGCPKQWPKTPVSAWGARYGGISNVNQCAALPKDLSGSPCKFRFTWFKNADNPQANFERVPCPAAITSISKCKRNDD